MEVQLQSVLIPQDGICGITDMYYHDAFGRLTFDGYFNLIYPKLFTEQYLKR